MYTELNSVVNGSIRSENPELVLLIHPNFRYIEYTIQYNTIYGLITFYPIYRRGLDRQRDKKRKPEKIPSCQKDPTCLWVSRVQEVGLTLVEVLFIPGCQNR